MTEPGPEPMPSDLWWSPSLRRFLARHENQDDEHLVWVFHGHHEALRHYLSTGPDSNPPMPDDAVRLVLADPAQTTELERLEEHCADVVRRRSDLAMELDKRTDERDLALWLHAEQAHRHAVLLAQREQWWETVAKYGHDVEAQRDRLSLLLRGMARKLVASRRHGHGWHDQWMSTRKTVAERQARIDAAFRTCDAAEVIAKIGSMEDPNRWKVVFATVTDVRAALNGELPAAEEPARLHITIPDADAAGDLP